MTVRQAGKGDIPQILDLIKQLHEESRYSRFDYDQQKVSRLIETLIELRQGIALVSENNWDVNGVFLGAVQNHWFGNSLQSLDFCCYVRKGDRDKGLGKKLIERYIKKAKELGVDDIMIATTTAKNIEELDKKYKHTGFTEIGKMYTAR